LTQAGSTRETPLTVADVFTSLPTSPQDILGDVTAAGMEPPTDVMELLIARSDQTFGPEQETDPTSARRTVLVGGPGQGKSTVTQFLAQVYRAAFLFGSPVSTEAPVADALHTINASMLRLGLEPPISRRWPIRIVMTRLADALSSGSAVSLLDFIAQQVSARGSLPVTNDDMRRWLRTYPWIVIIDGLDEVPKSSNREEVLQALNDFFIDSASLKADVTVAATTRPQGYYNELDPRQYAHFDLIPLDATYATAFAASFISLRTGPGSERSEELLSKFVAATREESTSRLLASPLQCTIFVILIERLGKAPRDRWRLFSAYYRVIFQREQEKPGPLAGLLTDYQQDIEQIHRKVGFVLQEKSSEAGGTSSYLTFREFERLIDDHLLSQGHRRRDAKALRKRLISLATEGLVFLAFLGSDQVGFEIRSLQEFMAGEYIALFKRRKAADTLKSVAQRSHWDNVVLFALGKIFAENDQLKPEVVLLCQALDVSAELPDVVKPGANLALNVLMDGACATQPRYEELLTHQALRILDGPVSSRIGYLVQLLRGSKGAKRMVLKASQFDSNVHLSARINRLLLLGEASQLGYTHARHLLADSVRQEDPGALAQAVALALEHDNRHLLGAMSKRAGEIAFADISKSLRRVMASPLRPTEDEEEVNLFVLLNRVLSSGIRQWERQRRRSPPTRSPSQV